MKISHYLIVFIILNVLLSTIHGFIQISNSEHIIVIDSLYHADYGFSYPLTYELNIDQTEGITFFKKYKETDDYVSISESAEDELFNGIETFRIDNGKVYLSVAFSHLSDTIYIHAEDNSENEVNFNINRICPYYDNREAAVTCSADDMAGWSMRKFKTTISKFRFYQLYLTCGINTGGCNTSSYSDIQGELDAGFVEAASHTRTHPGVNQYNDYDSEITGCKNDIINHLSLPAKYKNGNSEYVYIFIAPNGYRDEIIDSLVAENKHLVNRLYYSDCYGVSEWNQEMGVYDPIGVTRAIDPPASRLGWGIGSDDINDLNSAFDEALANNSVYHVMCHPNVIEWDSSYTKDHLEYISRRKNIWYASMGHVYLYHLGSSHYSVTVPAAEKEILEKKEQLTLYQSFPNPFQNSATISYQLNEPANIKIIIYNQVGQKVSTLFDQFQTPGYHEVKWNGDNYPSGCYFISVQTKQKQYYRKALLVK